MATRLFLSAFLVVCSSVVCSGWLIKGDWRNCFCKAVDNHNYATVRRDFGSIQKCHGFPTCGCRRTEMITCGTACERKVKEWACYHKCGGLRNIKIKADYGASSCGSGRGHTIFQCGSNINCGFKK